jgi:hypothetical protein
VKSTEETIAQFFSEDLGHIPLVLNRIDDARILWINPYADTLDPNFQLATSSGVDYSSYLLETCSCIMSASIQNNKYEVLDLTQKISGTADRYGGLGIGYNGGSGRNSRVGNYFVKGCGRTPLVSHLTDFAHASGGAYLEEAVREAIYSETVRLTFPHGAVPVLAIIDTGIDFDWPPNIIPNVERRVLVVRPLFLRPAHFERAVGFVTENPHEGMLDHNRVSQMYNLSVQAYGQENVKQALKDFFDRWAHQLSFGFINRVRLNSNTTSNVAIDGRLLDFGSMSAVSSWARYNLSHFPDSFESIINSACVGLRSIIYYFGRHVDAKYLEFQTIEKIEHQFRQKFRTYLGVEFLIMIGISKQTVLARVDTREFRNILQTLYAHIQFEQLEIKQLDGLKEGQQWEWSIASI